MIEMSVTLNRNPLGINIFVSNMNDNFHEASFEVNYISASQKLGVLKFSPNSFLFHFDLSHFPYLLRPKYEPQPPL